ncbi:MAG: class I SAM-dependent methyltransferase family protein [Thermoplasmata archaeon]
MTGTLDRYFNSPNKSFTPVKSLALKVPKRFGEEARKKLVNSNILKKNLIITRDEKFVYFPIMARIKTAHKIISTDFEIARTRIKTYRDIITVPEDLKTYLPKSFDIIGEIAVVKVAKELLSYKKTIGDAILTANKNVKTVAVDEGVKNEYRIRKLNVVSGDHKTETIHREHGIRIMIDLAKAYYSPRLATERMRVAKQVKDGEIVIDMFAGVGPFSLTIAMKTKAKKIFAIDVNPAAIEYLKKNIELNKAGNILPLLGDAGKVIKKTEIADRIIMNLPHSAIEYFGDALNSLRCRGIIHYYSIVNTENLKKEINALKNIAGTYGRKVKILEQRIVRNYSPTEKHIALDLTIFCDR